MTYRKALLAATLLAAPVAAKAEAVNGLYIGAGVGANFQTSSTGQGISFPQATNPALQQVLSTYRFQSNLNTDTGWVGLASVGWGFGNGLRAEVEGDYYQNRLSNLGGSQVRLAGNTGSFSTSGNASTLHGDIAKYGAFVNALYDFDPNVLGLSFIPFPITPYLGVGIGWQNAQLQNASLTTYGLRGQQFLFRSTNSQGSFAYQAIVGVAFPLGMVVPGLSLTTEYRFMGLANKGSFQAQFFAPNVATRAELRFGNNYNNSILLGVRYNFVTPPPPPPVQPAPAPVAQPTRTYLVFFDWDRYDLTERARQIISEAAQASQRVQVTRIEVNGYTDLSGTAKYNQGLSVRRANAVAAELVRDGVPQNEIVARGFGESNPLVPTAQGVREPQNRRVEIILR